MEEKRIQDSIENAIELTNKNVSDSIIEYSIPDSAIVIDSMQGNSTINPTLSDNETNSKDKGIQINEIETTDTDKPYSYRVCAKYPFLKPILIPKEDTYTGLASALNIFEFICLLSCFISLLFFTVAMLIKFIECNARKSIVVIELFSFLFLVISQPNIQITFSTSILWGYWCCLGSMGLLVLYDIYIAFLKARHMNTQDGNT
jgi:hypothetical protein